MEIAKGLAVGVELQLWDAAVVVDDDGGGGEQQRQQQMRNQRRQMQPKCSADLHKPLLLRKLLVVVLPAELRLNPVGSIHHCC